MKRQKVKQPTLQEVKDACRKIIAARNRTSAVNYAVNYARVMMDIENSIEARYYGLQTTIKAQALYTVGNIVHWKAPEAKWVRDVLKRAGKVGVII